MGAIFRKAADNAIPRVYDCAPCQIGHISWKAHLHLPQPEGERPERGKEPPEFYEPTLKLDRVVEIFRHGGDVPLDPALFGPFAPVVAWRANHTRGGRDVQLFPPQLVPSDRWPGSLKKKVEALEGKAYGGPGSPGWAQHPAAVTARIRLAQRLAPHCIDPKEAELPNGYYKKPPKGKFLGKPGRFAASAGGPDPIGATPTRHDHLAMEGVSGFWLAAVDVLISRMSDFAGYTDEFVVMDPTSKGWMTSLKVGQPKVDDVVASLDPEVCRRDVKLITHLMNRQYQEADVLLEEDCQKGDHRFAALDGHRHQGPKPIEFGPAPGLKLPIWPMTGKPREEWDFVGNERYKETKEPQSYYPGHADPDAPWPPKEGDRTETQLAEAMRSRVLVQQHNRDNFKGKAVFLNAWEEITAPIELGMSQLPHRIRTKEAKGKILYGREAVASLEGTTALGEKVEGDTTRCDHQVRDDQATFTDWLLCERKKLPRAAACYRAIMWSGPRYSFSDVRGRAGLTVQCHPARSSTWLNGGSNPTGIHRNGPDNFVHTFGTATHNACVSERKRGETSGCADPTYVANRLVDALAAVKGDREFLQILADSFLLETGDTAFADVFRRSLELPAKEGGYGVIGLQHGPSTGLRYYDDGSVGIDEENFIVNLVLAEWWWNSGLAPWEGIRSFYARAATSQAGDVIINAVDLYFQELTGLKGLEWADFLEKESLERGLSISIPADVLAEFNPVDKILARDPSKFGMVDDWRTIHPWLLQRLAVVIGPDKIKPMREVLVDGLKDAPFLLPESKLKEALQIVEQKRYDDEWRIDR